MLLDTPSDNSTYILHCTAPVIPQRPLYVTSFHTRTSNTRVTLRVIVPSGSIAQLLSMLYSRRKFQSAEITPTGVTKTLKVTG